MIVSDKPRIPPLLVLFIGVLGISSGSILVRLSQGQAVPSLVIAAWRLTFASLVLLPLAISRRRDELAKMTRSDWQLAILSGFMLALHFATWISSLAYTSVTSSTVLVTTSPLWVGLTAPFLLGESLTRQLKAGILLAMVGSVLIGLADVVAVGNGRLQFSLTQFTNQPNPLLGNGLALFGAVAAAFYLIIGRRLRPKMSLLSYTAVVYGTAAIFLLIAALVNQYHLFGYTPLAFLFMLLMAVFPQLVGHTSYNYALGYLSAAYVSIAVIAEPIGATILALILFGEVPNLLTIFGSILLLAGIVYASWQPRKKRR
ncbi:MAG: DMT family transporter [Ardenticatenaceae bacterium]|nr:DMT family transporter [Anaerolineales bacterium]MCB8920735.1 DMT family transporter [Ardenticatenaceae bacterium]MCB8989694.1 DMT family transporter [Ardenticatenaceae bacterium]MCB9002847.1 DMT family transporter [Ardenticatenaceae bacterium]